MQKFFLKIKVPHSVIWNDGPRMKSLDNQLSEQGLAPKEPGKEKMFGIVWIIF